MASRPTRLAIPRAAQFSTCPSRKRGLASREMALNVAERMMERDEVLPGCHITPYFCDTCQQWHVFNRVIVRLDRTNRQPSALAPLTAPIGARGRGE